MHNILNNLDGLTECLLDASTAIPIMSLESTGFDSGVDVGDAEENRI